MQKIGRYYPIALLGKGGMATVYLSVAPGPASTRKLLVIKQVRSELANDEKIVGMFLDEARLATVLNHPSVVQTYEVLQVDEGYYLVMEYIEGQVVRALQKRGYLRDASLDARIGIVCQLLSALHYAHEAHDLDGAPLGIVHRDVSPQNLMISYDGHAKLMDFGVAKVNNSSNNTETGNFKGKVAYASPEQVFGPKVDRRADVFASGVVLAELVTGQRFWGEASDIEILGRLSRSDIPRIRELFPDVPAALATAIDAATTSDVEKRTPTALAFLTELEAYSPARNHAADARALAQLLQSKFESERRQIRTTIEAQLKMIHADARASHESLVGITGSLPELGNSSGDNEPSGRSAVAVAREPRTETPAAKRGVPFGAMAAAIAVLVGVAALALRARPTAGSSDVVRQAAAADSVVTTSAPAAPAPPLASAADTRPQIEVTLSAEPRSAQLFLDGKPLSSNPARVRVSADDALHEVRAAVPGSAPVARVVKFNPNDAIALTIAHGSPAHAAPPSPHRPAPAANAPTPPNAPRVDDPLRPAATVRTQGLLDEKDPYK